MLNIIGIPANSTIKQLQIIYNSIIKAYHHFSIFLIKKLS
jgi:hypothetical protein